MRSAPPPGLGLPNIYADARLIASASQGQRLALRRDTRPRNRRNDRHCGDFAALYEAEKRGHFGRLRDALAAVTPVKPARAVSGAPYHRETHGRTYERNHTHVGLDPSEAGHSAQGAREAAAAIAPEPTPDEGAVVTATRTHTEIPETRRADVSRSTSALTTNSPKARQVLHKV